MRIYFVLFLLLYLWLPISTYGQPPKLKELKGDKLEGNILPAEKKGVWGYIDEKGSFLIKPVFEKAFPFVNGYAIIKFSDKYGVINRTAKYIYAPIYDDISTITTNGEYYYVFTKEGKKGISDDMFNFIIEHKKR